MIEDILTSPFEDLKGVLTSECKLVDLICEACKLNDEEEYWLLCDLTTVENDVLE